MSGEFSEHKEALAANPADQDPASGRRGPERRVGAEQYPVEEDRVARDDPAMIRKLGEVATPRAEDDGWGQPAHERGENPRGDVEASARDDQAMIRRLGGVAITRAEDDGWGQPPAGPASNRWSGTQELSSPPTSGSEGPTAPEVEAPWGGAEVERAPSEAPDGRGNEVDDGWGPELVRRAAADNYLTGSEIESTEDMPVPPDVIAERTTVNRIDLADNVRAIDLKESYDGYLDVVMHGQESGTQAYVDGRSVDFTLSQTAQMIESSMGWEQRPIRLLSCSTGRESYAQELSDRLDVPVYAPNGTLHVLPDGQTFIESPDEVTEGAWRRFEPGQ